jgi:hypothetical protein
MRRLILHQLRHRPGRGLALGAGILVAAASFSLLTAATSTEAAQTTSTVQSTLRPAYDILVRPAGTESALEQSNGLVRDNYLSGIYGGITLAQYRAITKIPGVEIAAPIAIIGTILVSVDVPIDVTPLLQKGTSEVLTLTASRSADNGLTHFPSRSRCHTAIARSPGDTDPVGPSPAAPPSRPWARPRGLPRATGPARTSLERRCSPGQQHTRMTLGTAADT